MAGRIGAGEKWEVKDGGMGGWVVIGLLAVHGVYTSGIVTRAFLTTRARRTQRRGIGLIGFFVFMVTSWFS